MEEKGFSTTYEAELMNSVVTLQKSLHTQTQHLSDQLTKKPLDEVRGLPKYSLKL